MPHAHTPLRPRRYDTILVEILKPWRGRRPSRPYQREARDIPDVSAFLGCLVCLSARRLLLWRTINWWNSLWSRTLYRSNAVYLSTTGFGLRLGLPESIVPAARPPIHIHSQTYVEVNESQILESGRRTVSVVHSSSAMQSPLISSASS